MESVTYQPDELKGREYKDGDYTWVYVNFDNKGIFARIANEDLQEAYIGNPVRLWNPWVLTPQGWAYVPATNMTIEPFYVSKVSMVALVHWKAADNLTKMCKQAFSGLVLATEKDIPKEKPVFVKG